MNKRSDKRLIITIDGPAGVGKTTIARKLARRLNINHIDTGAMYRAFAYEVLRRGLSTESEDDCLEVLEDISIEYIPAITSYDIFVGDKEVSDEIRTPDVTKGSSDVAVFVSVRKFMVKIQRELGEKYDIVIEGRDIGTYVFPDASHKFYLDANIEERVRRRMLQDDIEINDESFKRELEKLKARDSNDMQRDFAPLKPAEDAVIIDTTDLNVDEVMARIMSVVE